MNPYYNLLPQQRELQRLTDLYNSDEAVWRSLKQRRRLRRKLFKKLPKKQHEALDLLEFRAARPPDECVTRSC